MGVLCGAVILWPRPLAASPGEGVEEGFSSGVVGLGVVAGGELVFASVDPDPAFAGVEVEEWFEVCPHPWGVEALEADGLGRDVGLGFPDCGEA